MHILVRILVPTSSSKSGIENEEIDKSRVSSAERCADEMYVADVDKKNATYAKSVEVE